MLFFYSILFYHLYQSIFNIFSFNTSTLTRAHIESSGMAHSLQNRLNS